MFDGVAVGTFVGEYVGVGVIVSVDVPVIVAVGEMVKVAVKMAAQGEVGLPLERQDVNAAATPAEINRAKIKWRNFILRLLLFGDFPGERAVLRKKTGTANNDIPTAIPGQRILGLNWVKELPVTISDKRFRNKKFLFPV